MAFTQQNEKDGYLFFAIAFNAVPGKTYAAQVVQAYEAGMTTQQIVNEFTTKTAFTDIYGSNLSHADFAQSFVSNVINGVTISASVQTQAIADITAALDAGLSIGDVIFNVITNISNKSVADSEWGPLVQMLQNKVAVAEVLTEGEYALDTTDAGALQGPLSTVTNAYATVEAAIAQGASLKALLAKAQATEKAVTDYADGLGLLAADGKTAIEGYTDVKAALEGYLNKAALVIAGDANGNGTVEGGETIDTDVDTYGEIADLSATERAQLIASVKTAAADKVALAQDALTQANTNVNAVATLAKKGADWDAATKALTAANKTASLAGVEVTNQQSIYNDGKALNAQVTKDGAVYKINDIPVISLKTDGSGTYEIAATANPTQKTDLASFLTALNAKVAADKAAASALTAADNAEVAVDALDTTPGSAKALLAAAATAKTNLENAQKAVTTLDKAVTDLGAYETQLKQLEALNKAAGDAAQKLTDAGYTFVDLDGDVTSVQVSGKALLLVADAADGHTIVAGGFGSDDNIFIGSGYTLNATGDLTKGSNSALEVFFKSTATGTDVYVEQKAFGSGVANAADGVLGDIVKITLTGVPADKLVLKDGFITMAA